ncbi:MAG TPA: ABC transporter permease [Candidatus Cryosericum sp.]|nr:ABC transporter permease [Candidatus Cryosericum sp.]
MRRWRAGWRRLVGAFRRSRTDQETKEELESHLQMHIDDLLRSGRSAAEARRLALIQLGGIEQVEERCRERRGLPGLEALGRDLRFGARTLRRNPGYTAVAVLTLALGIGANSAVFSVVSAVLLRPLPYPDSERLVHVWATDSERGRTQDVASYPDFDDWRTQSASFEGLAGMTGRGMILSGGDGAELVAALQATPGLFELLGVRPASGRTFRREEGEPGGARVALLGDGLWKSRFAGRPDIVGQTVRLNEEAFTIVGVMPAGLKIAPGEQEQVYVPLVRDPSRGHGFLRVLGRLRPGVSVNQAQADLDLVSRRLAAEHPDSNRGVGARVVPLIEAQAGVFRQGLLIVLGVVALVLLIACTNVANLMLARGAARRKELAVRAALGAGRGRLVRQLLAESLVLAGAGGVVGLLLSSWASALLVSFLSRSFPIPRLETTSTDGRVLGFTLMATLATAILSGILPAFSAASGSPVEGLGESSRSTTTGTRSRRLRGGLVIAETALALVLMAGAGLLLRSLLVLRATAPGFRAEGVVTVDAFLPRSRLASQADRIRYYQGLLEGIGGLPGVTSAALVANLPLGGGSDSLGFHIPGRSDPAPDGALSADFNIASPGYFRTLGIPVREGREFTDRDAGNTRAVIVVNETAARQFWPGESALGREIVLPLEGGPDTTLEVVGVAGDVRQSGLGVPTRPEIFLDYLQPGPPWPWLVLVARTEGEPLAVAGAIRGAARSVDRDVPIHRLRTMDEVLSASLAAPRAYAALLLLFAALALGLASVGLYGVVSYTVTQRTQEMGIRLALGAARSDILRLVLRQGLGLAVAGTVLGLAGATALAGVLVGLVEGLRPGDPVTFLMAAILLLAVTLLASYLPARRATKVDPVIALRSE